MIINITFNRNTDDIWIFKELFKNLIAWMNDDSQKEFKIILKGIPEIRLRKD